MKTRRLGSKGEIVITFHARIITQFTSQEMLFFHSSWITYLFNLLFTCHTLIFALITCPAQSPRHTQCAPLQQNNIPFSMIWKRQYQFGSICLAKTLNLAPKERSGMWNRCHKWKHGKERNAKFWDNYLLCKCRSEKVANNLNLQWENRIVA